MKAASIVASGGVSISYAGGRARSRRRRCRPAALDLEQHEVVQEGDQVLLLLGRQGKEGRPRRRRLAAVLEGGYELHTLPTLVQAAIDGFES